jgi:hypothetical protein
MDDIDSAWLNFCDNDLTEEKKTEHLLNTKSCDTTAQNMIPKCSSLNISTKTKISYLNRPIDLNHVFWNIPLIKYHDPCVGIVKKQMKFNSTNKEEVDVILKQMESYVADQHYIDDYVISQIHKSDGRIKFKDIRKISIGICKKDIISYRCKRKSAFYNCFVVILRLFHNEAFKEIHVKVFNTGKLEIPGIQDATILDKVLTLLVELLSPIIAIDTVITGTTENKVALGNGIGLAAEGCLPPPLAFIKNKTETVMINSNFSCGYYINREKMYRVLKYKYKINSNFDPCSYPGIQCEFYHDSLLSTQCGTQPSVERSGNTEALPIAKVSFMIFRTGSVLIVGKCSEELLYQIYEFLCTIFVVEYDEIKWVSTEPFATKTKDKTRKMRKKTIFV